MTERRAARDTSTWRTRFVHGARAVSSSSRARAIGVVRRISAERAHGTLRLVGIFTIAILVALFVFGVTFAGGVWVARRGAYDIAQAALAFTFLGLMGALILSSIGHAATAYFTAHDLWFWESAAAPRFARFVDRLLETALTALPSTLTLGALAVTGFLLGLSQGGLAVARALVSLVLVAVMPLSLGVFIAHTVGALLPAGRLRRVSLVVLGLLLTALLIVVRQARVEDLVTAEGAARLVESARSLESVGPVWLPHNVAARFVLTGDVASLAQVVVVVVALVSLAFLSHAFFFDRARDRAADESPTGLRPGSLPERVLLAVVRPLPERLRPLVEKDLLAFVRDPAQWGQVILLLGVGVLYLVNASAMTRGFESMPAAKTIVMTGLHTGVAIFIAAGLSVRFGFPQVGLEGPAVWLLEAAPVSTRDIVHAKALAALPVTALFPTTVAIAGGFVVDLPPLLHLASTLTVLATALCFALYAVARGAERPAFDAVSVSELAMGPGALGTMMTTLFLSFSSTIVGMAGAERATFGSPAWQMVGVVLVGAAVPVALFVALRAVRRGARALDERRRDGTAGREGIGR